MGTCIINSSAERHLDKAHEAGTRVTGGQTVLNPWMMIGGVATSVERTEDVLM